MNPPVLFLVFNRPAETRRVLERILACNPGRLYVAADGPRPGHPTDASRCQEARAIITLLAGSKVTKTLYRENNLGCRQAVSGAIDWFFSQEESGVILEDDCLPQPAFFDFMGWALARHQADPRVWHVSGMGLANSAGEPAALASMPFIWGWGSWRDRWKNYDVNLPETDESLRAIVAAHTATAQARDYWLEKFTATRAGIIKTWDYQWVCAMWRAGALAVIPAVSYVENIGFGADATHTMPGAELGFAPLRRAPWAPPEKDWAPSPDPQLPALIQRQVFQLTRGNLSHQLVRLRQSRLVQVPYLALRNLPHRVMSGLASLRRRVTRLVVGRDWLWSLFPSRLRRWEYLRIQRDAELAVQFERRRDLVFADKCVRQGPFAGMQYPKAVAVGSAYYPKILGSYEAELQAALEAFVRKAPPRVIDIGFAEGYYLVGLGRRLPEASLVGYDISQPAHDACTALARANGVASSRLRLHEAATSESLRASLPGPSLVICDCEGFEEYLFTRETLPLWPQSDLIIECHDHLVPGIGDAIASLLQPTHRMRWISSVDAAEKLAFVAGAEFAGFRPEEKSALLNEGRPGVMRWIIAEARAGINPS